MIAEARRRTAPQPGLERVSIIAPARLHLGFLDLNGDLGRRFGSLGVTLDGVYTRLHAELAPTLSVTGPSRQRVAGYVDRLSKKLGLPAGLRVVVEEAIPEHVGLGSGTQLGLAVAAAMTRLHGLELNAPELVRRLDRGLRSAIGMGAFATGGVLLDGGIGTSGGPPPIISRLEFPPSWRILLMFDHGRLGLHGGAEAAAFRTLRPFPATLSAHLCRLVVMTALPALVERDFTRFSQAVAELQRAVGDHFAPYQGGRYASPVVAEALAGLAAEGVEGIGQSSWGPTGFALLPSEDDCRRILDGALRRWANHDALEFRVSAGRNRGGEIEVNEHICE